MKNKLTMLRILVILCCTFGSLAAFGQASITWNGSANGTNLGTAGNWVGGVAPNGANGDTAVWDGVTTTNLVLSHNNPAINSGYGTVGINLYLTANQTNSVQLISPVASSANLGVANITMDSGAGSLIIGDGTANVFNIIGRPTSAIHDLLNNSTNPAIICPNVRWQAGGGLAYTLAFDGTGTWIVTNNLENANNVPMNVAMLGTGKWIWAGPSIAGAKGNNVIASPVTINEGTVMLESSGLLANQAIANNGADATVLQYDAAAQSQTLGGVISGPMAVKVSNGTLTLSGASTYSGNTTLSGGELIVNSTENAGSSGPLGVGGMISFTGGTLGFSANNTFDYSSRFDTTAGQAYSFDTAGQSVTFGTALGGTGSTVTKLGSGTITLSAASTYTGLTTVSGGRLLFQASKTGSGNITVADGATLSVTSTGTQVTPATLTVGTSSGATLGFNNVNSTTTALIAAGTLASAGTITINVNSGTFAVGQSYPLVAWTTGSAPPVSLGVLNGFSGNLSFTGNELVLNITGTAYTWTGANNGSWDLTTANNWVQNGGPKVFANGGPALFDDTASGAMAVTIGALVLPTSVTVNNSVNVYSMASSTGNDIGGSTGLTKSGSAMLTLSGGANTYTGVTTLSGGTLSVGTLANGGSASDIGAAGNGAANLMLDGGTLQYTGGAASCDHLFTLTPAGGTIDASGTGALVLNNGGSVTVSSSGPRTLTLTGADVDTNTLAAVLSDSAGGGATSLTKSGAGTWILTGNNTQSGATTIANGVLQIGNGGATGSPGKGGIVDNSALDFNLSGSLTVSGVVSGPGSVTNDGTGTVILAGDNTYTGPTTVNAGTLQIGNGGATGSLYISGAINDNGVLIFNSTESFSIGGGVNGIAGTGNVIKRGSGVLKAIGANTYTGWTEIDAGATFQPCEGNTGELLSSVVTNNGTLKLVRQDYGVFGYTNNIVGTGNVFKDVNNPNPGDVTFMGTNTYTGGTIIAGGAIILGDGVTVGAGSIVGNVVFTNSAVTDTARMLEFNRPDNLTFSGIISGSGSTVGGNQGTVLQNGTGVLTLTGNNSYAGGTTISNGVLQVGAGGTTGSIGTNNATDYATLVFDRSDNLTFGGAINGTGSVVQLGSGTLTLSGAMNVTGPTTVSNGTLVVSLGAIGNDLDVSGGTIAAAPAGSIGTLMVTNNMNIASGTVLVTLNKTLSQSNSVYSVAGAITSTGGALKLVNYGPNLVVGDKFTVFNQPVSGGAGMTIVSPGVTFANNLATDGSVTVSSIAPVPSVTAAVSGGQLQLSWPAAWTGAHLQMQTNSLAGGLGTNWVTIPGTDAGNSYMILLNNTNKCVFYRLAP